MNRLPLFAVIIGAALPLANAWGNTVASVTVKNDTSTPAAFTYEYAFGTFDPVPSTISGNATLRFVLNGASSASSGMRFTYSAGSKRCKFEASHITIPNIGWTKKATSTGSARATCEAKITRASATPPYDYGVEFTIR
ncbi:hypothetical protein P0Y43_19875 [Pseudomonas entomophila]|uniref:hypothetical protein n=1 Tax=Pseudomonas entomophila TaxID=312306 RepID=UPI0023D8A389|nr:hypothetical protein [Pseudomonas entomophila]MDF0732955.1 hypothetical protein [Pseudomonas entomophila]